MANYELVLHFPGDPNALLAPAGTTCMWYVDLHVGKKGPEVGIGCFPLILYLLCETGSLTKDPRVLPVCLSATGGLQTPTVVPIFYVVQENLNLGPSTWASSTLPSSQSSLVF